MNQSLSTGKPLFKESEMMGENTKIQWCDHTFNPWVGCTKVSPGCKFCYAEADMDKRRHFAQWGPNGTRVMTSAANWRKPLKWNREAEKAGVKRVVFCASLADVFEDWTGPIVNSKGERLWFCGTCRQVSSSSPYHACPNQKCSPNQPAILSGIRAELFGLIDRTPNLIWRILTKRPENIRRFWPMDSSGAKHRSNVHLYTSVENQEQADERIPHLMGWNVRDLAPVRGISAEPLLGPIDVRQWLGQCAINHVIVGGESGPEARPFNSIWADMLKIQCAGHNVPFFMKQFGSTAVCEPSTGCGYVFTFADKKGGDITEWPTQYRVRELPETYYSL